MQEYKDKGVRRFLWFLFAVIVSFFIITAIGIARADARETAIENREREYYRDLYGE